MNILSVLSFLAFVFCVYLFNKSLLINRRSGLNRVFAFQALAFGLWNLGMSFFYVASSYSLALRWYLFATAAFLMVLPLTLRFFILFTGRDEGVGKWVSPMLIYLSALIIIVLVMNYMPGRLELRRELLGWMGYESPKHLGSWLLYGYSIGVFAFGLFLLFMSRSRFKAEREKRQVKLITILSAVFLLASVFITPLSHFYKYFTFLYLPQLVGVIWLAGMLYAIEKFGLLSAPSSIFMREVLSHMQELFFVCNEQGDMLNSNRYTLEFSGYRMEHFFGRPFSDFIEEDDKVIKSLNEDFINRKNFQRLLHFRKSDGAIIPVQISAFYVRDEREKIAGWMLIARDMSSAQELDFEKHKMTEVESALRESELQYKATIDAMDDMIHVIDGNFKILLVNKALQNYVEKNGLKKGSMIGEDLVSIFPFINDKQKLEYERVFQSGRSFVTREEREVLSKVSYYEVRKIPVMRGGRVLSVLTVIHNMDEQKKQEEQSLRAEKLESLAVLAGGIAHDFNNILTGVLGNISIARHKLTDHVEIAELLKRAERAGNQARELTGQLLTFSKGGSPVKKPARIMELLKESVSFVVDGGFVELIIQEKQDSDWVDVDQAQIQRVFHNILINAMQSMPQGGRLSIFSENIAIKQNLGKTFLPSGKYLKITIKDQGKGMDAKTLSKIFDPFYTTKTSGLGLGLSTTFSIMKSHGGLIDVQSEENKGTAFILWFPCLGAEAEKNVNREANIFSVRVLLMDDEEMVLEVGRDMLESLGCEVHCVTNGRDAVKSYTKAAKEKRKFDLVILDLKVVKGMGAMDTQKKLLQSDPDVRSVISSGYSNDPELSDYKKYGFVAVLNKPYALDQMKELLKAHL